MLNWIWVTMLALAVICGALSGKLDAVTKASVSSAGSAVDLAIGLVGIMALWLGLMKVLQRGGLLGIVMRKLSPLTQALFPEVPPDHPAMTMIVLNMTANMLGLTNAATPFGLKAMMELDKLNRTKGTATNSMALLLAINTSNIALLPTGMIGMRAALGAEVPGSILVPTLLATTCSTIVAIIAARSLAPLFPMPAADTVVAAAETPDAPDTSEAEAVIETTAPGATRSERWTTLVLGALVAGALIVATYGAWVDLQVDGMTPYASAGHFIAAAFELTKLAASEWLLSILIVMIVLFGLGTGVKVYDTVVEVGKEGFQVALRIIPFLVAMLVAVAMLRASGAIDILVVGLSPVTQLVGMPAEVLPLAIIRTLSGNGAFGVAAESMTLYGPDSLLGNMVSVMCGSTDTTFYVLAVYYGVIGIKNTRHTLPACLLADTAGALAGVWFTRIFIA